MKINSLQLKNIKLFKDLDISFVDKDINEPHNVILLVGENGKGKTSILKSIASCFTTNNQLYGGDTFGYNDITSIEVSNLALKPKSISIGEDITFSFNISTKKETKIRLEYGIDYVKANGKRNRKIFQISEVSLNENQKKLYTKKHSFEDVSTRKHYPGTHTITLIVNGTERGSLDFEVK